jgi:hypothetical protein
MTIDEAIEIIEAVFETWEWEFGAGEDCDKEHEAIDMAIKALEQLQKIQEIIKSWKDGTIEEKDSIYAFHKIYKVVESEEV